MKNSINYYVDNRYSAKSYDIDKKISQEDMEKIKDILRLAPSSVNAQPWHFMIISSQEAKEKLTKSTHGVYQFNIPAVLNASHVIVFCGRIELNEKYMSQLLVKEEQDGRFLSEEYKTRMHGARSGFINSIKDRLDCWVDKQVYLNVGQFLISVATLGIDATPMEGFDSKVLDEEFDLNNKGLRSVLIVPIGYHQDDDFNAKLPKSRLLTQDLFTEY